MRNSIFLNSVTFILLVGAFHFAGAECQEVETDWQDDPQWTLFELHSKGCLGGDNDPDEVVQNVLARLRALGDNPGKVDAWIAVGDGMEEIISALENRADHLDLIWEVHRELRREWEDLINYGRSPNRSDWSFVDWESEETLFMIAGEIRNITKFLESCEEHSDSEECARRFQATKDLVRFIELRDRLLTALWHDDMRSYAKRLQKADEAWRQYASEARSQFPWELWLNSYRYEQRDHLETLLRSPPDHQIILFHPGVGMEYVHGADRGDRFQPTALLEWAGYNRWRWDTTNDQVKMKHPLGISVISAVSDRSGTKRIGHGLLVHYKHNFSIGVTLRGNDPGLLISLDLGKLLSNEEGRLRRANDFFRN